MKNVPLEKLALGKGFSKTDFKTVTSAITLHLYKVEKLGVSDYPVVAGSLLKAAHKNDRQKYGNAAEPYLLAVEVRY